MTRLIEALLLFAVPFVVYGLALAARRRMPRASRLRVAQLGLAGLALVLVGFLLLGTLAPRREGAYEPAHLEGGHLVPGRIR